jgi:cytochrome b involved in lipid metabolism
MSKVKGVTKEEVAKHKSLGDIWVLIHGKVYDVSNFKDHPGGYNIFLDYAGGDSTTAFEEAGHGDDARMQMNEFYIGPLVHENERVITEDELRLHNSENDCWIVVHDNVYDVSKFKTHPGGFTILAANAGKVATEGFEDAQHSPTALAQMKEYYVGKYKPVIYT